MATLWRSVSNIERAVSLLFEKVFLLLLSLIRFKASIVASVMGNSRALLCFDAVMFTVLRVKSMSVHSSL